MLKRLHSYITNPRHFAAGLGFLILSVLFSFWITRIPEVKGRLNISEAELGIALFFIPVGGLVSMLLSSPLIRKWGEGRTSVFALITLSLFSVFPVLAISYFTLCASLFLLGFGMGWTDIAINAVVNTIEKEEKVFIMSTSHGFFSLGGIVGGSIGGILAGLQVTAWQHMLGAGIIATILILLYVRPRIGNIHDHDNKNEAPLFAFPRRGLLVFSLIGFAIMTSEGAVTDWSTVYLKDFLLSSAQTAGFGFAAFSATMTFGRFLGDYLIHTYGSRNVVFIGCIIAIGGTIAVMAGTIPLAIIGFALIGLGFSCAVPVVFSSASKVPGINPAYGLAAVASSGFFGFLIGPVIMGFVAEEYGLDNSFYLVISLTIIGLVAAVRLPKK